LEQKPIDDQLDGHQCWWVFVQAIPFPPILVQGVKVLMAAIHLPMEDEPSFFELVILAPGLVYFAFCALHVTYFIPLLIVVDPVLLNFAIHGHLGRAHGPCFCQKTQNQNGALPLLARYLYLWYVVLCAMGLIFT